MAWLDLSVSRSLHTKPVVTTDDGPDKWIQIQDPTFSSVFLFSRLKSGLKPFTRTVNVDRRLSESLWVPSIYRPPTLRLTISAITDWWRCSDAQRVPLGGTYPYQEHTGQRLEVWGDPGQRQVESERIYLVKIFHFSSLLSGSWWRRPTVCQRVGYLSLSPLVRKFTFSNRKISLRHHDAITRVFTSFLSVTMI